MSATNALGLSLMKNALGLRAFLDVDMAGGIFYGMPVVVSEVHSGDGEERSADR